MVFVDEEVQGFAAVRALCVVHPAGINPDNLGGIGAFDGEINAEASLLLLVWWYEFMVNTAYSAASRSLSLVVVAVW